MGALLPRRMSTEPAPSSPESSDSRKRRSLLALSSVTRKPATAANAALREEVQQALAAEPALLEPLLAALPAEALQLALAAVRRRRPPAAEESAGDAATGGNGPKSCWASLVAGDSSKTSLGISGRRRGEGRQRAIVAKQD